jgi:hypothetical protein
MNWKGFKREPWWGTVSEFAWRDWGQPIKPSVGITCAEAETRTEALPSTSANRHRWNNLLSSSLIESTVNKVSVQVVYVTDSFGGAAGQGAALSVESSTLWTYNRMYRYELSENSVFISPLPFVKQSSQNCLCAFSCNFRTNWPISTNSFWTFSGYMPPQSHAVLIPCFE